MNTCSVVAAVAVSVIAAAAHASEDGDPAMTSPSLRFDTPAAAPALSAFLLERARATWGAMMVAGGVGAADARFTVGLYASDAGLRLEIREGAHVLTERVLAAADTDEGKAAVWLIVKSTIERARRAPRRSEAREELAPLPPTPRRASAPVRPQARPRFTVLAGVRLGEPEAVGASLGLDIPIAYRLRLGPTLAYTYAERARLRLQQVGFGALGALAVFDWLRLGATVEIEAKVANTDGQSRSAVGASAGPFAELGWTLGAVTAVLRLGAVGRLVRQRYVLAGGTQRETSWAPEACAGVAW